MKKLGIFVLTLLLAGSMCACRFGGNDETTEDTGNQQQTDIMPEPSLPMPTVIDPTIETNIPDPNVDNDHMIDDTGDSQQDDMSGEDGSGDDSDPMSRSRMRRRFR